MCELLKLVKYVLVNADRRLNAKEPLLLLQVLHGLLHNSDVVILDANYHLFNRGQGSPIALLEDVLPKIAKLVVG